LPLGTPLDGSIVVLDVESGEILAMVSSPTFAEGGAMDRAARTTHAPFVHRAAEATYPPGSIVKPLVYVSAVSTGAIPIDKEIECAGHLLPDKTDSLRCWIYKMYNGTHGLLGASEAIKRSCNIYFYTLGQVMGLDRLTSWYRKWGLDEYLDTGLRYEREVRVDGDGEEVQWRVRTYGESTGFVPHYADIASQRRSGESIMLGIGQGLVTWTPLQAANAYATLARGGTIRDASLLREEALRSGRRAGTMHLDPEACLRALDGLHRVVNDRDGTGYSIRYADSRDQTFVIPGARVWGKTGTASAPPLRIDVDGDGVFSREGPDQRIKGLDHAWFVGLAGEELEQRPRYAIAVLVEYGGSGGRVAGPIAAEVIRVLTVHGYLGGGSS
jgi:penicillin-binding protein 2